MRAPALILAALTACGLGAGGAGLTVTRPTAPTPTGAAGRIAAAATTPAHDANDTDDADDGTMGTRTESWISMARAQTLIGKPVAEATRLLESYGQTGPIAIDDITGFLDCVPGVVCAVNGVTQPGREGGRLAAWTQISLGVNKAVVLGAPPPE